MVITVFSACFVPFTAKTQILNIERFRMDKDTAGIWMGNISFGFSGKKQLNYVSEYTTNLNLAYLTRKHSYMTINHLNIQKADNQNIISEGYSHWRVNFMRRKHFSYEPFIQVQYDLGRGLLFRNLYGFSLRLNIIKLNKEKHNKVEMAVNEGIMYEYEKWQGVILRYNIPGDSTQAETTFIKSTTSFFTRLALHEKATFFGVVYYQARYDLFLRPRIISDLQLVFNLSKHFSFSNQLVSIIDTYPIVENNRFTYTLTGNLIVKIN